MRLTRRTESTSFDDVEQLAALTRRARKGDRAAFDEIVRATYDSTFMLALRLTGNESDARDVAQDVYLRAYRSIGRFRGDAQITTWLYRITANCASTTVLRRSKRTTDSLDAMSAPERLLADASPASDPELAMTGVLEREAIERLILRLPPRLRAVVVLRDAYDLSHEAIAEELGISETAAKVRLHRARKLLRSWLDEVNAESGNDGELVEVSLGHGDTVSSARRATRAVSG